MFNVRQDTLENMFGVLEGNKKFGEDKAGFYFQEGRFKSLEYGDFLAILWDKNTIQELWSYIEQYGPKDMNFFEDELGEIATIEDFINNLGYSCFKDCLGDLLNHLFQDELIL